MPNTRSTVITLLGAALVTTVVLTGCSAGASDSSSKPASGGAPAVEQVAPEAAREGGAAAQDAPAKAPDLGIDQRSIVYTGSITVRVKDVTPAAAQVTGIAAGAGGFIGSDERHQGDSSGTASMTLRVPAEKFSSVVDQLATLGKEENRGLSTEDVTEETVDLDARITVQQARVDSGRRLLSQAKSLNDLVMLEKEVATRESDLASLQAKKRRLADLTALSTITVTLLGPEAAATGPDDDAPGFLAGLTGGWNALVASLSVLVTVVGALLPWLIALGLPVWGLFWAIRRYRRGHRQMPAVEAAPAKTAD